MMLNYEKIIERKIMFNILNSIKNVPILCIGDIMLDSFIEGKVDRISPEAPIPILQVKNEEKMLGGVGNVYSNLKALGCDTYLISVVGNDKTGYEISSFFNDGNTTLLMEPGRISTKKTRYRSGNQQLLRVDEEITKPITDETKTKLIKSLEMILPKTKAIIISDYGKGLLTECCEMIISVAHKHNNIVLVDPKGKSYYKYSNADVITPNLKELSEITGITSFNTIEEIEISAKELIKNFHFKNVIVKRSEKGMLVVNDKTTEIKSKKREVFDVSGAGDTVISTLSAILALGHNIEIAAEIANIAGGIVVTKQNTATITVGDIVNELRGTTFTKIIDINHVGTFIECLRNKTLTIGFTNGCYDLLHQGHIETLKQAKSYCDYLIVGLNSDASVKKLKGESRPVLPETARATILSALKYVDLVVIFDDETPLKLIEIVKPDVLIKGSDYTIENIVGGEFVQSYGGEVKFIALVPGFSTTSIIEKLKQPMPALTCSPHSVPATEP